MNKMQKIEAHIKREDSILRRRLLGIELAIEYLQSTKPLTMIAKQRGIKISRARSLVGIAIRMAQYRIKKAINAKNLQ